MTAMAMMFTMMVLSVFGLMFFSQRENGLVGLVFCAAIAYASISTMSEISDDTDDVRDAARNSDKYQQLVTDNPECSVSIKVTEMKAKMFLKCPVEDDA